MASPRLAAAQPVPGVEVRWVAPAGCPQVADVQARLHRLLGAGATSTGGQRLVADATVAQASGRFRLSLRVRKSGEEGETRVFDSDSCESLAGAAAVTLALLVHGAPRARGALGASSPVAAPPATSPGSSPSTLPASLPAMVPGSSPSTSASSASAASASPEAATSPRAAAASPFSTAPPPSAPSPTVAERPSSQTLDPAAAREAPADAVSHPAKRRWSLVLGGPLMIVDEGVLPSWALGTGLGIGIRVDRFETLVTGALWLTQNDGTTSTNFYGVRYTRRSGEWSSCYEWGTGAFELGPCITASLEDVVAQGTGPGVVGGPAGIPWITVGLGARARWSPRRWTAVFVRPTLVFNTSRPRFAIDALGSLYQVPLAAVGINVGCEWIL